MQSKNQLDVYNKILKKAIREAKIIYHNNEFDKNKNNIRRVWGTMNEIISKKNKKESCIKTIIKDGKRIRDPKKIVETSNNFHKYRPESHKEYGNESKQTFPKIPQSEYTNVIQLYS